jgi:hypothetical protein
MRRGCREEGSAGVGAPSSPSERYPEFRRWPWKSLIYFDPCFDRFCEFEALQQRQRQRATSGGVDNKLRLDRTGARAITRAFVVRLLHRTREGAEKRTRAA